MQKHEKRQLMCKCFVRSPIDIWYETCQDENIIVTSDTTFTWSNIASWYVWFDTYETFH